MHGVTESRPVTVRMEARPWRSGNKTTELGHQVGLDEIGLLMEGAQQRGRPLACCGLSSRQIPSARHLVAEPYAPPTRDRRNVARWLRVPTLNPPITAQTPRSPVAARAPSTSPAHPRAQVARTTLSPSAPARTPPPTRAQSVARTPPRPAPHSAAAPGSPYPPSPSPRSALRRTSPAACCE